MSLQPIREEIDRIDQELVTLFKKRMDCAKQVGEYKKTNGLSVLNEAREKEILDSAETAGGEYGHAARLLFSSIMELSRALQHDITGSGKALRTLLDSLPGHRGRRLARSRYYGFSKCQIRVFCNLGRCISGRTG